MKLTDEQFKEAKRQLSEQIKNLPAGQRVEAQAQIDAMSREAIEEMVRQQESSRAQIFRMIVNKEVESVVVGENSLAIAVLEINPLSKGHALVIPKKAALVKKEIPQAVVEFAKEIAEKIKKNLKPSRIKINAEEKFGEAIVEVVPEYDGESSARTKTEKKDLEEIAKKINTIVIEKPKPARIRKSRKKKEIVKLGMRIP